MQIILVTLIKLYQKTFSFFIGGSCRFHPSCSAYAIDAIKLHGSAKGSWLTLKRITRCHPLHVGGIDNVPTVKDKTCLNHSTKES